MELWLSGLVLVVMMLLVIFLVLMLWKSQQQNQKMLMGLLLNSQSQSQSLLNQLRTTEIPTLMGLQSATSNQTPSADSEYLLQTDEAEAARLHAFAVGDIIPTDEDFEALGLTRIED